MGYAADVVGDPAYDHATCLADVLHARAERTPDALAYETASGATLGYAQLAGRASVLARRLAEQGDGPVLLLEPAGIDYVVAIFAAFLAGIPVVPAYPPDQSTIADRERLARIVTDARPSVAVAEQPYPGIPTVDVPGSEADDGTWYRAETKTDVAVVQYTSGSTGRPRGVLVRHDALAANTAAIVDRFGLDATSRALTWLPPYHDMGLVGGILTPLVAGIPVRLMRPADFLKAPLSWLRQITESGATASGGPNFAYDLCVRRAHRDDALDGLDLSRWRVAFNGAETVRRSTLTAFADRFAPVGFDPRAFLPCYGLAEATLIVSAGRWADAPDSGGRIGCGTPVAGQHVLVVDAERGAACEDGREGEIWIAGPHVTPGYLSGDASELFGELDGERYLRTGDLGYLRGGALVPTGRTKDVIVYRGENHHAVDVESAALDVAATAGGAAAAFLVDTEVESVPVLVLEVRRGADEALTSAVRAAVLEHTGLRLGVVALVPPRSVPKTSSGKVRRGDCRAAYLAGAYDTCVLDRTGYPTPAVEDASASAMLTTLICGIVAGVCDAPDCRPTDRLLDLGVDSIRAAEAAAIVEDALGLEVPLDVVLTAPTSQDVTNVLLARWRTEGVPAEDVERRVAAVLEDGEAA
jgi:acyl-CoA synthetase (AMP-forming)/AMP-acid ligase II/acyl carrier protein